MKQNKSNAVGMETTKPKEVRGMDRHKKSKELEVTKEDHENSEIRKESREDHVNWELHSRPNEEKAYIIENNDETKPIKGNLEVTK